MYLSEKLKDILIKLKLEENANKSFIELITKPRISKEFLFIDTSDKDDYVRFIPNKKEYSDVVLYKLHSPTIVDITHEIYVDAVRLIGDKSKISKKISYDQTYRILGYYPAGKHFIDQYDVIHMENTVTGSQILNLQQRGYPPNIKPVFDTSLTSKNEIKIGRFLRKIITETNISDKTIESFVNTFKAYNLYHKNMKDYFAVVEGNDIKHWYDENNYAPNCSILNGSCMRFSKCQDYFDMYTNIDNNIKMVILTNYNGKLIGRALLWETSEGKYMDRVYGQDHTIKAFLKWAEENKYNLSFDNRDYDKNLKVDVNINLNNKFPYLDTFRYMKTMEGDVEGMQKAVLTSNEPSRNYYLLSNTNGSYNKYD